MKTVVTIITTLKDAEAKDVVLNVVYEGEPETVEQAIMSQSKIRVPLDDGGILYVRQDDARVVTFRKVEEGGNGQDITIPQPSMLEVMAEA